jgi:hypothetical protein
VINFFSGDGHAYKLPHPWCRRVAFVLRIVKQQLSEAEFGKFVWAVQHEPAWYSLKLLRVFLLVWTQQESLKSIKLWNMW